jgi:hypothetical protein
MWLREKNILLKIACKVAKILRDFDFNPELTDDVCSYSNTNFKQQRTWTTQARGRDGSYTGQTRLDQPCYSLSGGFLLFFLWEVDRYRIKN